MRVFRIALLHIAPRAGDLAYNCRLVESGVIAAATERADWVITPELCLSGYEFAPSLGTDWIDTFPDLHSLRFIQLARRLGVTLFLSHAEKDEETHKLHNSTFAIGDNGRLLGTHRNTVSNPPNEAWSSPGALVEPIELPSLKVGILSCADAYTSGLAGHLKENGAQVLISPASWPTTSDALKFTWEERSRETGLPIFVCNRTGHDRSLKFTDAESLVASGGKCLMTFQAASSSVVLIDWDFGSQSMVRHESRELQWTD